MKTTRMKLKMALVLIAVAALVAGDEVAQAATARFSGYTWVIRQAGRGGPGPNNWEPGNVLVDTNGYLHLRLTRRDGRWYCAEVYTQERFGFGRYEFWLAGPVDKLDRNVVLGLFNYPTPDVGPDGTHEIDIEFAQWGNPAAPMGNYTVWPATNSVRRESRSFAFTLDGVCSKHLFTWSPTNIFFESSGGGEAKDRPLASWNFQPTNAPPHISHKPMPVHLNLWCFNGTPPSNGEQVEIIVRAFKFTPL